MQPFTGGASPNGRSRYAWLPHDQEDACTHVHTHVHTHVPCWPGSSTHTDVGPLLGCCAPMPGGPGTHCQPMCQQAGPPDMPRPLSSGIGARVLALTGRSQREAEALPAIHHDPQRPGGLSPLPQVLLRAGLVSRTLGSGDAGRLSVGRPLPFLTGRRTVGPQVRRTGPACAFHEGHDSQAPGVAGTHA